MPKYDVCEVMFDKRHIPIFPLNILPLPDELIPLHIFEPKYRQLLEDIEQKDSIFGIYYATSQNEDCMGAIVKLESIIKRYPTGESDIVVKGTDIFIADTFHEQFKNKQYAGAEVAILNGDPPTDISDELKENFMEYKLMTHPKSAHETYNLHEMAINLDLDNNDRLKYVKLLSNEKRERFVKSRLKLKRFILKQERKATHKYKFN